VWYSLLNDLRYSLASEIRSVLSQQAEHVRVDQRIPTLAAFLEVRIALSQRLS
jgi:hypothetical protein